MFSHSSLTQRLRLLLFRSLIKQDIAFFELTKTGTDNWCKEVNKKVICHISQLKQVWKIRLYNLNNKNNTVQNTETAP